MRKIIITNIALCFYLLLAPLQVQAQFNGGDGTSENPYQVATATHLNNVRDYLGSHFIQTADIDLDVAPYNTGAGWVPIGGSYSNKFTGSYNGNDHTISGLFTNPSNYNENSMGLFGHTESSASLTKVGLLNANVNGRGETGILVGDNWGTISECYATGNVTGIEEVHMEGHIGGLVGQNSGSIINSYANSEVSGGMDMLGYTGGLVGTNYKYGTIQYSNATGNVNGESEVGGLVGANSGTVTQSFATGKVNGEGSVGGLVGNNSGTVTNSYATGTTIGKYNVGGLVGFNSDGTVNSSYATGKVSGTSDVGGLVGRSYLGAVTTSYWNTETSERSSSQGGTGLTTAQMRAQSSFTGWDFSTVWAIKSGLTISYPYLRTNEQTPPPGEYILPFSGGDGTSENPYQVATATQLNSVRDYLGSHFIQTANIDLNVSPYNTGAGWVPIGGSYSNKFTGSYNGNDHTISGLFINLSGYNSNSVGLFGHTDSSASLTKVGLLNANVKGKSDTGILVGENRGTISECYATGNVTGMEDNWGSIGGLVGNNYGGTVTDSYANSEVSGGMGGKAAGGLVGSNVNSGTVTNSYATGNVNGESEVGGLVGANSGTVTQSFATGKVNGYASVGGLVGYNTQTVTNSYATGTATGTHHIGGLIGYNIQTVNNSYATGEVTGSGNIGGLVGINQLVSGKISDSYATGKVSGTSDVGGLIGQNIEGATATNSYWNTETSETASSDGGTGLTTAQMRAQSSFAGWDFSIVWAIKSDSKLSYPYLRTNVQTPAPGEKINPFAGGDGSEANPFQITTALQLDSVRDYLGSHFIQTADIDLNVSPYNTDAGWVPIGVYLNEFTGSYNGGGYTISGLFIDLSGNNAVGLFGYTGSSALITNVGVVDVDIKGNLGVGGLVGINYYGTVTNSFATGKVDGVDDVGGLIGGNAGTVSNTYATGVVTGSEHIGGLVGLNQYEDGKISESYATGKISGTSHVGGLIGQNIEGATATNSYWNTETSETASSDGGTGLTTAQMVDAANFSGWDFTNTWLIDPGFTFPMLKNANQHITSVLTIKGKEGWRMLSSPLKNTAYGALLNPLWLQGFTGADVTHGMPNVLTWNETAKEFIPITNSTDFAGEGTGFITYVFSDDNKDGTAEGFPKRLLNSGAQHIGPVSPSITFTESDSLKNDGWNLLGNPYGTTIDWDAALGWNRTNLDASYYVWSDTASGGKGAYLSWNGLGGTLPNSLIAPGQGFWVKASSASPSISLNDTVRSSNGTFFKRAPVPQLKFNLQNNEISSNTIVMFSEKAERGKDPYDAYKMNSLNTTYLSLFTELEDGSRLDINALPLEFEHPLTVEMGFEGSDVAGTGTLSWEVLSLPSGWSVHLTDRVSGASVNLKDAAAYSFTVNAKTKSNAKVGGEISAPTHPMMAPSVKKKGVNVENRFVLLVSSKTSVAVEPAESLPTHIVLHQNYPNPFNPSTSITFGLPESGKVRLEVFDMVGRKVATLLNGESKAAGRHTVNFDAKNLSSGMYIYRLQAGSTILTKKLTLIK